MADLGGAEMHTEVSGVADHFAVSEPEAMERVREAVEHLNTPDPNLGKVSSYAAHCPPATTALHCAPHPLPALLTTDSMRWHVWCHLQIQLRTPVEPLYPADDLDALAVPPGSSDSATGATRWVPVREVLARLLDGSEFSEFKLRFGPDMVTGVCVCAGVDCFGDGATACSDVCLVNTGWEAGFGHLEGIPVGIVGNQGNISRAGAQKAAHFIEVQTSDAQQMPEHASNAAAVYPH